MNIVLSDYDLIPSKTLTGKSCLRMSPGNKMTCCPLGLPGSSCHVFVVPMRYVIFNFPVQLFQSHAHDKNSGPYKRPRLNRFKL